MKVSVIVPTYKRPHDLERCLKALKQQSRAPHQVIITVREDDGQSWEFLNHYDFGRLIPDLVSLQVPGVVAALNQGLERVNGDIVAITDDDAEPLPNWIEQIAQAYADDAHLGALGGKDWIHIKGQRLEQRKRVVGIFQWIGRPIGNHCFGYGAAREVDILKGVNMTFRRSAMGDLQFDDRLLGQGAQVHFEMSYCLALKRANWKIVYDPNLQVNHYLAQRHDEDQRDNFHAGAKFNTVFNETLIVLDHVSGFQRMCFVLWAIVLGTRSSRGLIQTLRFFPLEGPLTFRHWLVTMQARWSAWKSHSEQARVDHAYKPVAVPFAKG